MAVEISSGASALALALVVGTRVGFGSDAMRPHNLTLVMLGAGLLWFGWYGFNAGSALARQPRRGGGLRDHHAAPAAAGSIGWLALERVRDGHATTLGAASGMVAGLVAITPSGGSLSPSGRSLMGLAAGVICALAVGLKYRWGYDDSLDVVGVHLVGGLVGTLGIGLIATGAAPTAGRRPASTAAESTSSASRRSVRASCWSTRSWSRGCSPCVVHRTMGFRIDEEHEVSGIDLVIHAETAYDLHATAGARSSGGFSAPKATSGPFASTPASAVDRERMSA